MAGANYVDPGHKLLQEVRRTLAAVAGTPNHALPLSRLAQLYARLAQGNADPLLGSALGDVYGAMTQHPDLVSGEARCDLAYMNAGAGDWVAKVGADAVRTIGMRSAGLGIAIKIADGAMRAAYREPEIKSVRGATAGQIRAVLKLQRAA